jgi:hypothetical protein
MMFFWGLIKLSQIKFSPIVSNLPLLFFGIVITPFRLKFQWMCEVDDLVLDFKLESEPDSVSVLSVINLLFLCIIEAIWGKFGLKVDHYQSHRIGLEKIWVEMDHYQARQIGLEKIWVKVDHYPPRQIGLGKIWVEVDHYQR